jgi:cytidylate kinase
MIIAIDGPAGSGKTTIGRMVAAALGFALVDTGLFYRAVTVEARRQRIEPDDIAGLEDMIKRLRITVNTTADPPPGTALVMVDGRDITREASDPAIARELASISRQPQVRALLVDQQRAFERSDVVVLGRDIGTVIFPGSDIKFFFTASPAERVARRRRDLDRTLGQATPDAVLEEEIEARDRADSEREIAPLRAAPDAIIVATEGKSVHQVFEEVMAKLPRR